MTEVFDIVNGVQVARTPAALRELLAPKEVLALDTMRTLRPEITSKYTDCFLLRFAYARKYDPTRAVELLANYEQLLLKYDIESPWSFDPLKQYFDSGVYAMSPYVRDRRGRPVMYVRARAFPLISGPDGIDLRRYVRFAMWYLDIMFTWGGIAAYREPVTMVEDFTDVSLTAMTGSIKTSQMKELMADMQDHIPMRLGQIFLVDPPWFFRVLYAIVRPFLKQKLRKKFVLTTREKLREFIDEDNIPEYLGGRGTFHKPEFVDELKAMHPQLSHGEFLAV